MIEAFDPSAFILAERSQTLAEPCKDFAASFAKPKPAEIRHSERVPDQTLATIATLAPAPAEKMPWDDNLIPWANGRPPAFAKPIVWDELTNEALSVSRKWGRIALDAGWSSLDLFGCYRRPQYRRIDCNGLVASIVGLLTPVRLTALDADGADLTDHHGNVMRHYRRDKPGAVHLWEAYVMRAGP